MQNGTLQITKNHNIEHTVSPFSPFEPSGPCEGEIQETQQNGPVIILLC